MDKIKLYNNLEELGNNENDMFSDILAVENKNKECAIVRDYSYEVTSNNIGMKCYFVPIYLKNKVVREMPEFLCSDEKCIPVDYKKAFTEIIEVLKFVDDKEVLKIPEEQVKFFYKNRETKYDYELNKDASFQEQELSDLSRAILSGILRDHLSSEYQRHVLIEKEKVELEEYLKEKKQKFKIEEMIKEKRIKELENVIETEKELESTENNITKALVEYKDKNKFFIAIDTIKKFFLKVIHRKTSEN